jgi:antitoxin component HigA of HigAB toxin-antitoxin module
VLRRDRPLSLAMIRRLNQTLNIPAEVLIRPVRRRKRTA